MLLQLIIIQAITFVAIVAVLRKLLYTETAKEAKRLKDLKDENARTQTELNEKIQAAEKAYAEKMAKAENDIKKLHAKAEEEAEGARNKILDEAKIESEQLLKSALNSKDKIREELLLKMREDSPALALQIFKEILSAKAKEAIHKELLKEVVSEIRKSEKARFNFHIKEGEFDSAYPLDRDEKKEIVSLVCDKLGYNITVEEKEKKELAAGIVIKLGGLVIDGSLLNRMRQVKEGLV